jgi:hypothetical protein
LQLFMEDKLMKNQTQLRTQTRVRGGANANSINLLRHKFLSILVSISICLTLVITYIPTLAYADENHGGDISALADGVAYIDENGNPQTADNVTAITSGTATLGDGWYIVTGSVARSGRITVNATSGAHLILADGCNYTVTGGIGVHLGNNLTIYGQSGDSGRLTATASNIYDAGIGGTSPGVAGGVACGDITINGGIINATGQQYGAGIGSASDIKSPGGTFTITINGGNVTGNSTGGFSAGIGNAQAGRFNTCNINITGGTVLGTSMGGSAGSGIGGANSNGSIININISGGIVTGSSLGSAGIGGNYAEGATITISGGYVTGTSTQSAGIGGGAYSAKAGDITITGGTVIATGGGIGGDIGAATTATSGSVIITGGSVNATRNKISPQATNDEVPVYLTTLTLNNIVENTKLTALTYDSVSYDAAGISTSDEVSGSSKVYVYLPADTYKNKSISATVLSGDVMHNQASITVDEDGSSVGTLYILDQLSGIASITGNAIVDTELSVNTGSLLPVDFGELSYIWKRSGSDVSIGTDSTYTLTTEDIGHTITVTISSAICLGEVVSNPTATVTVAPEVFTYNVLSHFGTYTGAGSDVVKAHIDADHAQFIRLLLNGKEVDPAHYAITKGSTIITLTENHLNTYANGKYVLTAEFADGTLVPLNLEVNVSSPVVPQTGAPQTGDDTPLEAMIAIVCVSLAMLCLATGLLARRKVKECK